MVIILSMPPTYIYLIPKKDEQFYRLNMDSDINRTFERLRRIDLTLMIDILKRNNATICYFSRTRQIEIKTLSEDKTNQLFLENGWTMYEFVREYYAHVY